MTALAQDRKTDQLGTPEQPIPPFLYFGVEGNTTIYGGALVAVDASGYAVPASATNTQKCVGRALRQVVNTTAAGFGTAGALSVTVEQGVFWYTCPDSTITAANYGAYCYAVDDNNVSLSDAGGTRPVAGYVVAVNSGGLYQSSGTNQVAVAVGDPSPYGTALVTPSQAYRARAVITSIQAYGGSGTGVLTESSNGAFATQDGVTIAANDIVFLQAGTTNISAAKDAGPWQVTSLGGASAKWVLTRPDWWATGSTITNGATIEFAGDGSIWGGTAWKSFASQGTVVDTTDPAMYPRQVTQQVTLVAGTKTISNVPIYSASRSQILCSLATPNTATSTVMYGVITAMTPGAIGTSSAVVDAIVANQTKNASDVSTINVTIFNG